MAATAGKRRRNRKTAVQEFRSSRIAAAIATLTGNSHRACGSRATTRIATAKAAIVTAASRVRGIGIAPRITLPLLLRTRLRTPMRTLQRRPVLIFRPAAFRSISFRPVFLRRPPILALSGIFLALIVPPSRGKTACTFTFGAILSITVIAVARRRTDLEFIQLIPFRIATIPVGDG